MASDSRALTLKLLADVADFQKKMDSSSKEVEGFGGKLGAFADKAKVAFAAAGAAALAYAGKLLVDGVKAAMEDEKAQASLAKTLQNTTGATNKQIAAVEDYVKATSLATGITDDELRPSLDRLVRSTNDVEKAQKLQKLALDVAAGSGKSLQAVSDALAKAYDGNTSSLARLGVGLSSAELKSMSFDKVTETLAATFKDQASAQADTFSGKMARLSVAFDEAKETVGAKLLPILTSLIDTFNLKVVPAAQAIIDKFRPLMAVIEDNKDEFKALWSFIDKNIVPILTGALKVAFTGMTTVIGFAVTAVGKLVNGFQFMYDKYKQFVDFIKNNPLSKFLGKLNPFDNASFTTASLTIPQPSGLTFANANFSTGSMTQKQTADLPSFLKQGGRYTWGFLRSFGYSDDDIMAWRDAGVITLVSPEGLTREQVLSFGGTAESPIQGFLDARAQGLLPSAQAQYNITVNGALDAEGTARTIIDLLNQSQARGTLGATALTGSF